MVAKQHNVPMFENTGNDQMDLHKCTEENAGALMNKDGQENQLRKS